MIKISDLLSLNASKKITLKITFPFKFSNYELVKTDKIIFHKNQTLEGGFRDYMLANDIKMKAGYCFFLIKDGFKQIELSKEKIISDLNLKENDEIIISYKKHKNENHNKITDDYSKQTTRRDLISSIRTDHFFKPSIEIQDSKKNSKGLKAIISIIIILIIISIVLIILFIAGKKKNPKKNYNKEEFIVEKKYPPNVLYRYISSQDNSLIIQGSEISKDNSSFGLSQTMDFIFIVRENHLEQDEKNLIEKEWYTGYIGFLNVTMINSTHKMLNIYDNSLTEILNKNNLRRLENLDDIVNENKLCFAKIEFYKNGNIRKYYIPKEFSKINFKYIEETAKLIIPKISSNLYIKNITEKLNEICSNNETEENDDKINNTTYYRGLKSKSLKIKSKILETTSNKRSLESTNLFKDVKFNETIEDIILDNYLKEPSSESVNYDLREANKLNESLNNSNLTEFSVKSIECDEAKMEGGMTNSTIFSIINKDGILESIVEKTISTMNMENKEESEEDEDIQMLNSEVYNENNEIKLDDIKDEKSSINNVNFGINNITTLSSHIINCTDNFTNEKINQKLYKYFDSFSYIEYNKDEEEKEITRILEEHNFPKKYKRRLGEDNSYYGVNNFTYVKNLYKYNLVGLKMESQIYVENNPSTGKCNSYQIIIFGNKNTKIKMSEQQTNYHIILEKKNQMGYKLLSLLKKSNEDLIERNKNYTDIILDLENNITSFFNETYDYSNVFRESLNNLYDSIKDFSGEFFYELISLINSVHENFTIILQDVELEKYDMINQIRNITKEEYINYIYNMIDVLEKFENNTMIFLENIELQLTKVYEFQIDILYDIIDQIYECKLIFLQFNKNLFKSIEKGILTLKYDLGDYIEEIIGDLLYVTDFLAVNINKNELLIKAIDESNRTETTEKLKDFRNIVTIIMDILMNNVNNDYEMEMNLSESNSIKSYSYQKAEEFLNNTQEKSDKVIKDIKSKINDIELYELYSENLDTIDNIHNKTILEYMGEMYKNIINKSINIKPEYINEKSTISKNKKNLFDLSKNIANEINKEINEINGYISNYIKQYTEKNIYNIHYNMHYFRKIFLNGPMAELLNEFYLMVQRTIKIHFKEMIDYNFDLLKEIFDEEDDYFDKYKSKHKRFLCKEFVNRYYEFQAEFEKYLGLTYSDKFLNLLEKYFYNLRNDILSYIKNKIFSIKKYYFNIDLYKNEFYFHEQTNNEILKIIDNINNYYNEMNLDSFIKIKALSISQEILGPYHENKTKKMEKYYDDLYSRATNYKVKDCKKDKHDFAYTYWRYLLKGWKTEYLSVSHNDNLKLVLKDLKKTDEFLFTETEKIYNNFISKFDIYLNNYVSFYQNLYSNLYQYVENKFKNSKINSLINKYENTIIENLNIDSNSGLLQRLNNEEKAIGNNINSYLKNLEGNINLLRNEYFTLHYSKDYEKFLEYPKEIIYKINQFLNELKDNCDIIKKMINNIYKRKNLNIIKSTNLFIYNNIQNHYNYILSNINSNVIMPEYYSLKYSDLNTLFSKCFNLINSSSNTFIHKINNTVEDSDSFLNSENYNKPMKNIINNVNDFTSYLEGIIAKYFISSCEKNNTAKNDNNKKEKDISSDSVCIEEEKKIDSARYSKYNYYIVKLRTGIYYTKKIIENIYSLFDNFNFQNLISTDKIMRYDELLNDNNIININKEANNLLKKINKESLELLDDLFDYFNEDFEKQYTFKNDYLPLFEQFKKIISLQNKNFINNITSTNDDVINFSISLFNETLYKQISLISQYDYYNINQTYFKELFSLYNPLIEKSLKDYKNAILNLRNNYKFRNSFKTYLGKLQQEKRNYFKEKINNFAKNYNFNLLNMTYDLGELENILLKRKYEDYVFLFIYDYIDLIEKYKDNYINKIYGYVIDLENKFPKKFKNTYDNFYSIISKKISPFVNTKYVNEINYNHSICLKYSYDKLLNESKEDDNMNYELYNNISSLINLTFANCSYNKIKTNNTKEIPLIDKINFINNSSGCVDFLKNNQYPYTNEIMKLLECYKNNFYNLSVFYFNNFTYKEELDKTINKILEKIKNNYIDESFIHKYLEKYYQLDYKKISLSDISYNFEDIENMINYINNLKNNVYKNYLYDSFIKSFNYSYYYLVNNYLIDELIDDISISIIDKLELNIEYMTIKIKNEFDYYLLILNNTDELGYSSKNAFISLYQNLKKKLNETLFYLIEDDIYFYLNIFYRENKNLFRDSFINYYYYNLNKYEITIFKLSEFFDEIIVDKEFNKTLDKISKEIIQNNIIKSIKDKIKEFIEIKLDKLYNMLELYAVNIKNTLDKKKTKNLPDSMKIIDKLVVEYAKLVNNQNNHYLLKISEKPFNILYYFINNNLEPPLTLIKEQYNSIEERLLNELLNIITKFPDNLQIVKERLDLEYIFNYISTANENIKDIFIEYKDILNEDFLSYINKLIHFTYINGLYTYDHPCNDTFCFIDIKSSNGRRLEKNNSKYIFNFPKANKGEVYNKRNKKVRKLKGYDHTMGAISKDDIISFLFDIESTLFNFNKTYLGKEFKNINKTAMNYFNKINNTYLIKLRRNIEMVALKFLTFLTKDNYKTLEDNIFRQYNEILSYINSFSDLVENKKNSFVNYLDFSSKFLNMIFNLSYNSVYGNYQILCHQIENKQRSISEKELKEFKKRRAEEVGNPEDPSYFKIAQRKLDSKDKFEMFFAEIKKNSEKEIKNLNGNQQSAWGQMTDKMKTFMEDHNIEAESAMEMHSFFFTNVEGLGLGLSTCKKFDFSSYLEALEFSYKIQLGSYVQLVIEIKPFVEMGVCLDFGTEINWKENEYSFYFDIYAMAEVGLELEFGAYVPSSENPIKIAVSIGLKGNLGSGKVGMKLSLYIGQDKYSITLYTEFEAFKFGFYIKLKFEIDLKITHFTFEFYLFDKDFSFVVFQLYRTYNKKYNSKKIDNTFEWEYKGLL